MLIKTAKTIKKGDIFRTEYGDYNNYVDFVFMSCKAYKNNCTEITVRHTNRPFIFNVYEFTPIDKIKFNVIREAI